MQGACARALRRMARDRIGATADDPRRSEDETGRRPGHGRKGLIPAIFAITQEPFVVYTSNVFAILGLRALYFLLAGVIHKFHFLKLGLSAVLVFVGTKMLLLDLYPVPVGVSLIVIALVLGASVGASLLWPKAAAAHDPVVHDPLEPIPAEPLQSPPVGDGPAAGH